MGNVDGRQALAEIKRLALGRQIRISSHVVLHRLAKRNGTPEDIRSALLTAVRATYQSDRDNWKVTGGVDTDDDDMTVIVVIEADLIIVTFY